MISAISIGEYFEKEPCIPIIDVRSPGEFRKGHIKGAVSIPLFSDDERASVGTVYVQSSKEEAMELGLGYVQPKLDWFIREAGRVAGKSALAIHCWRGGMRSKSFAEHLESNGFSDLYLIKGGYKSYRNYVLSFFEKPFQLRIVGGFTGSGKTYILKFLKELGEQVVDLEGLAHHKGSAFGAIGEGAQPTVEQFENNLFHVMRTLNIDAPVWIEDESHKIGKVSIPITFFRQIREGTVFFVDIPKEQRSEHLVKEYASFGNKLLSDAIHGISKRLGGQNVKLAHQYLEQENYHEVAMLALQYYDKAYRTGVMSREQNKVLRISLPDMNHLSNAESLIKFAEKNERD